MYSDNQVHSVTVTHCREEHSACYYVEYGLIRANIAGQNLSFVVTEVCNDCVVRAAQKETLER